MKSNNKNVTLQARRLEEMMQVYARSMADERPTRESTWPFGVAEGGDWDAVDVD